jgi:hypothetical protein
LDFAKVLGTLASFFGREGYRYAAVGAFGLHAYGLARATLDLDLATESAAQPKLVAFLESLGYETLYRPPATPPMFTPCPISGVSTSCTWTARQAASCSGRGNPAARRASGAGPPPEHLIAMKVHAMKNDPSRTLREMADIQFLLSLPSVDEAEVRAYFEQSGLLERYLEIKRLG